VRYQLTGTAGQLQPPQGYLIVDEGGVSGIDTHAFTFTLRDGVPINAPTKYTVFAAGGGSHANNPEDFLLTREGTRLGPSSLSPAHVENPTGNLPPVIRSTGGAYKVSEGKPLALKATADDRETPWALRYSWDLKADGTVDATGRAPVVSAATLAALGLGDGTRTVNVRLTVGDGTHSVSALTKLTIVNVKPTAGLSPAAGLVGRPTTLKLTATDPSAADRAAGFRYVINWGDGAAPQTINPTPNNGAALFARHTYTRTGVFTATLTAVDKDGAFSSPVTALVTIRGLLV
jgi:hypothetical protein